MLGVTLVGEVVLLLALGVLGDLQGRRPGRLHVRRDGAARTTPSRASTAGAFGTGVAAGTAAIGIFFAFWSWVGFETTAVYGEESTQPEAQIIPRATLIAVVGLGLFYTFMSWMVDRRATAAKAGRGLDQRLPGRPVAEPGAANLGGVAARHLQDPARDRLVRLRDGLPQRRRRATSSRSAARSPWARVRDQSAATRPHARLAVHRLDVQIGHHAPDRACCSASSPRCRCPTPTARWPSTPRHWCPTSTSTACWR